MTGRSCELLATTYALLLHVGASPPSACRLQKIFSIYLFINSFFCYLLVPRNFTQTRFQTNNLRKLVNYSKKTKMRISKIKNKECAKDEREKYRILTIFKNFSTCSKKRRIFLSLGFNWNKKKKIEIIKKLKNN